MTKTPKFSPSLTRWSGTVRGSQDRTSITPTTAHKPLRSTNKPPPHNAKRQERPHPSPPHKPGGWQPQHTTYTTQPINPYLDARATRTYEIAHHPTIPIEVLIHSATDRLIATMTQSRLQKLRNLYHPNNENTPLPKAIAELILRQKAKAYDTTPIKAHPLH